jgi:hypothetical protein
MGDRSVIGIKDNATAPTLYLYSHWSGSSRYGDLFSAIQDASVREGDNSYFTRIFISALVGEHWAGQLGYGLSVNWFVCPDYADIPVLNLETKSVEIWTGTSHDTLVHLGDVEQQVLAAVDASGSPSSVDIDGIVAAIVLDMGMPPECVAAFVMIPRSFSTLAHHLEEKSQGTRWRHVPQDQVTYTGPMPQQPSNPT